VIAVIETGLDFARRAARRILLRGDRRPMPTVDVWQHEYQSGGWQHLWSDEELPRYALLAAYLRQRCPGGDLLDLGCGQGILCDRLWPGSYASYLGVDLSATAIARASARHQPAASYQCADVERYVPEADQRFDAVVFNEVLYYFAHPEAVVARFVKFLKPDAIVLASLFEPSLLTIRAAIRKIDDAAAWKQQFSVTHQSSEKSWIIKSWGGFKQLD
jgi:2-polyprenyl-3-methyl-5-hydroxy-6-metoxy-1,4-benzoquinol methylase